MYYTVQLLVVDLQRVNRSTSAWSWPQISRSIEENGVYRTYMS